MATTKRNIGNKRSYSLGGLTFSKRMVPSEFLRTVKTKPDSIKSSTFVAPKIGSSSLGEFEVEFK